MPLHTSFVLPHCWQRDFGIHTPLAISIILQGPENKRALLTILNNIIVTKTLQPRDTLVQQLGTESKIHLTIGTQNSQISCIGNNYFLLSSKKSVTFCPSSDPNLYTGICPAYTPGDGHYWYTLTIPDSIVATHTGTWACAAKDLSVLMEYKLSCMKAPEFKEDKPRDLTYQLFCTRSSEYMSAVYPQPPELIKQLEVELFDAITKIDNNKDLFYTTVIEFLETARARLRGTQPSPAVKEQKLPNWQSHTLDPTRRAVAYAIISRISSEFKNSGIVDPDPLVTQLFELLKSPTGLGLCDDDPNLSIYGNEANRIYVISILFDAVQSLRAANIDFNLLEDCTSVRLSREEFTECLSKTRWNNTLVPYSAKMFHLATSLGAMITLPILQYFQLISWLGDPSLTGELAIPATIALDLYFQILTKNVTAQKLFRGFVSRAELDRLSERDRKSLGPVVRFNDGRVSFDEKNEIKFFHRNLVLTDFDDKAEYHKLMFMFDARTGVVKEADESWKTRYVRRKTQPKPRDSRELDIDFRQILTAFNTALRPVRSGEKKLPPPKELLLLLSDLQVAAAILSNAIMEAQQKDATKYIWPSGRTPAAPDFDPKRGNRV